MWPETLAVYGGDISTCNLTNLKFDDFGFKGTKLPPFGMLIFEFVTDDKILGRKVFCRRRITEVYDIYTIYYNYFVIFPLAEGAR